MCYQSSIRTLSNSSNSIFYLAAMTVWLKWWIFILNPLTHFQTKSKYWDTINCQMAKLEIFLIVRSNIKRTVFYLYVIATLNFCHHEDFYLQVGVKHSFVLCCGNCMSPTLLTMANFIPTTWNVLFLMFYWVVVRVLSTVLFSFRLHSVTQNKDDAKYS